MKFALLSRLLIFIFIPHLVSAKIYTVGGEHGWTTNLNFSIWSEAIHFYQGDLLEFVYDLNRQSVFQVHQGDFDSCNYKNPIKDWSSGTGIDVVPLNQTGTYYFISGSEFCFEGVKLYVNVSIRPQPPASGSISTSTSLYLVVLVIWLGAFGNNWGWIWEAFDDLKKEVEKKLSENLKAFGDLKQDKERIVLQKENVGKKSEVGSLNDDVKRVAAEKSEIQTELELKKKEELSFSFKVKKLEKGVDESKEQRKGTGSLAVEIKELATEKSLLGKKLVGVEMGNQCLTSKMNSDQRNSEKALLMLKDAAQAMYGAEDEEKEATVESDIDMMKIEEDIQPFASVLEGIKNALNKDKKMEEITRHIENPNKSAKKNSNIWIRVSSTTTILAAAAATYISRGQ